MPLSTFPLALQSGRPKASFSLAFRSALSRHWLARAALVAYSAFALLYGLGASDLWRTENLRALGAVEMLRTGDWLVPHVYGQPLLTKPPAMYAAIALASLPFGEVTETTARLPSVLAAALLLLLFAWYFHRTLGPAAAPTIVAILPLSFMWLDKASTGEIDMLQAAWVGASILFALRCLEIHGTPPPRACFTSEWLWWLAAMLCVAAGFLTKWTAPIFFYGALIPLLACQRRLRLLLHPAHLLSAALASLICGAWIAAVIVQVGYQPLLDTFQDQALGRMFPTCYEHPFPWSRLLTHPFIMLASSLPVFAFALLTLRPSFFRLWDAPARRLLLALHCWAWPNLLLWSFVSDYAPRQRFPLFPAIAALAAMAWLAWLTGRLTWPLRWISPRRALVALMLLWLALKLVYVDAIMPARNARREVRLKGDRLASWVPHDHTLHIFSMIDQNEGILFYYRRPIQRLTTADDLPSRLPSYCLVTELEWQTWNHHRPARVLHSLPGELRGVILLIEVLPNAPQPA